MRAIAMTAALGVCVLSGCYAYVPSTVGEVAPQQKVRLRLSPDQASRLNAFVKPESRTLDGTVVSQTADSLLLLVPGRTELTGTRVETFHQRVEVGKAGILDVDTRRLDRQKTYLLGGLIAATAAAVAIRQLKGPGGSALVPPGGGPTDAVRPPPIVWKLPFRLLGILGR